MTGGVFGPDTSAPLEDDLKLINRFHNEYARSSYHQWDFLAPPQMGQMVNQD